MDQQAIALFASSPAAFRDRLMIAAANGPARFGDVIAPFQAKDFEALDTAFLALRDNRKPEMGRFWLERTKGASKDSDLAVELLWLLAFSPRPVACQVGAADADQADEIRKVCKSLLRLNPWLMEVLEIQGRSISNVRTESRCEIIPADVGGSHGARPDLLILNEISHISKEEFARNLLDNASKVPHGVVVVMGNAGFTDTWQHDLRQMAMDSDRWYFSAFTRPAPWLDPKEIEETKRRNPPLRYDRLWQGQWVRGSGDALSGEDIVAAVVHQSGMDGMEQDFVFYAGVDVGISRDHTALAVIGLNLKLRRVRLAFIQSWAPRSYGGKVDLEKVEEAIREAHARYNLKRCFYDPFQCEAIAQTLSKSGVPMEAIPFTSSSLTEMATVLLERFHDRTVELFPDPGLMADLHGFKLIDKGLHGYRLDSARTSAGHGDKGTGFVLALLAAERYPCGHFTAPALIENDLPSMRDRYHGLVPSSAERRGIFGRGAERISP